MEQENVQHKERTERRTKFFAPKNHGFFLYWILRMERERFTPSLCVLIEDIEYLNMAKSEFEFHKNYPNTE